MARCKFCKKEVNTKKSQRKYYCDYRCQTSHHQITQRVARHFFYQFKELDLDKSSRIKLSRLENRLTKKITEDYNARYLD